MAPTDLLPSSGLRRAATSELQRIDRARARLVEREERLRAQIEELKTERAALDERARLLGELVGTEGNGRGAIVRGHAGSPQPDGKVLRGRELREAAAQILYLTHGGGHDVHYRQWLDDFLAAGYEIVAKDPVAAFLTTVSRSPLVVRGAEPGTYRLELGHGDRLRRELAEAEAELADLARVIAKDPNPTEALREHRTRLLATIRRLEGRVAEVGRVLTATDVQPTGETPNSHVLVARAA